MPHPHTQSLSYTRSTKHDKCRGVQEWDAQRTLDNYNPGKNYRGQRVCQTKLYVFLQNLSHSKNYPPPTPNSMLANHLNILLKFKCGKQH